MSKKKEFVIEYDFQSSPQLLFQYLSTPSGLSEWFSDDVNYRGEKYTFFNPKFGLTYALNAHFQLYGSFAVAHREPVRTDFIDAPVGDIPSPEQLQNLELGFRGNLDNIHLETNVYLMVLGPVTCG